MKLTKDIRLKSVGVNRASAALEYTGKRVPQALGIPEDINTSVKFRSKSDQNKNNS